MFKKTFFITPDPEGDRTSGQYCKTKKKKKILEQLK
jgi:hypothetical protein